MCGGGNSAENDNKKPEDTDFRQQRLRAWQPLLTPSYVIGAFLLIGCIFLPIGISILSASNNVKEYAIQYDDSATSKAIEITEDMPGPVYFYYKLTNFYQNHRRYVKSRSDKQLKGDPKDSWDTSSCDPLIKDSAGKTYYPCGLIANSQFNDVFTATHSGTGSVTLDSSDIVWASDVAKFKDSYKNGSLDSDLTRTNKLGVTMASIDDPHFIVWMRNAGLPTFRKLYAKIPGGLSKGTLNISISNNFETAAFSGQKWIIISTSSWIGGKNAFLGYAYIIVGSLCIAFGIAFLIKHIMCGRPLGDMKYFSISFAGKKY